MDAEEYLHRARNGDADALSKLLGQERDGLCEKARRILPADLRRRVDSSDIVQQTLMVASRNIAGLEAESMPAFQGWLNAILENQVGDEIRRHRDAGMRSVTRETPLTAGSGSSPIEFAEATATTPSQHAMRDESALALEEAIRQLPDLHGRVVRLRYLDGLTVAEIATVVGKHEGHVRRLIVEGVSQARRLLGDV